MPEIIPIDLGGVNAYLLVGESGRILVDTGGHVSTDQQWTNRCGQLMDGLAAAGGTEDVNLIVLTHGHSDHANNAAHLRERLGAKIAMHEADRDLVENPTLANWMDSHHYREAALQQMFVRYKDIIARATLRALDEFTPFSPDLLIDDGFDLTPYGFPATVLHLPGHTAGSLAILSSTGDLIAGDLLANVDGPGLAPNADDFEQLAVGARRLKTLGVTTAYPGHGAPFLLATARI